MQIIDLEEVFVEVMKSWVNSGITHPATRLESLQMKELWRELPQNVEF